VAEPNISTNNALDRTMKWCNYGNHLVPKTNFGRSSDRKDGLQYRCKECRKHSRNTVQIAASRKVFQANNRERLLAESRQNYYKNRDKRLAKAKEYRQSNTDKMKQYLKIYYLRNRDKRKAQDAAQYWLKREEILKRTKKYYKQHRDRWLHLGRKRRALTRKANGSFTLAQWLAKCEYWGWRCYLCNCPLKRLTATADHRIPLSRGGSNWIANIAPACKSCNCSKRATPEREYRINRQAEFLEHRRSKELSVA
jgi:hypothetical protein